ncbi:MAG TPA: amidohydrolase family protein [Pseudolysinimonas sp.]|nr:amidohydrolase family protein [Pseudolysinimonas sp.]
MTGRTATAGSRDVTITRIAQLHTVRDAGEPRAGEALADSGVIEDAAVAIRAGMIVDVGPSDEVMRRFDDGAPQVDAHGMTVVPGLVESHCHPIFAGVRAGEYADRLRGLPADIMAGAEDVGINSTVKVTRAASDDELLANLERALGQIAAGGATVCEVKTGYGLTLDDELRQLRLIERARELTPMRLVPTFAGGHMPPYGTPAAEYAELLMSELIPAVAAAGLSAIHDVTCENGVFTLEQCADIQSAAQAAGMQTKVHADAFAESGGWELAIATGALSGDHLTFTSEAEIRRLGATRTVATVLPVAELYYRTPRRAPVQALIESGVPIAVATDFCSSIGATSLLRTMLFAAPWYGIGPETALIAATLNAAYALGVQTEAGSIDLGKRGDLLMFPQARLDEVFWADADPSRVRRMCAGRWME